MSAPTKLSLLAGTKANNLLGKKFGRLTVFAFVPRSQRPQNGKSCSFWKCRCDCGKEKVVRVDALRSGKQVSCGCFQKENVRRILAYKGDEKGRRLVYCGLVWQAKKRGLTMPLTFDQVWTLNKQDCFFCGSPPSNIAASRNKVGLDYIYNGIDRLDNDRGYEADNVVACCARCNHAKHTMLPGEFISLCHRVAAKHKQQVLL
jgi:5-methylcytosine-specific restriction endonuclease McrA